MNEMDALSRMRDWVPVRVTAEEALLRTAISAEHVPPAPAAGRNRRYQPRSWKLAVAGVAVLAMTAGIVAALALQPGPAGPAALTVRDLAYRAAAVAAAQPPVKPGQWIYWQEQPAGGRRFEVWTTANSTRAAYWSLGKLHILRAKPQFVGPPRIYQGSFAAETFRLPVSYAGLARLPASPRALVRYLGHQHLLQVTSAPEQEFGVIQLLLASYRMPPRLTAELYRALADIPGVTIDRHAADIAGRHGIGFRETPHVHGLGADEIIINAHTYQLMGAELAGPGHPGKLLPGATAILAQTPVSGPGVRP